jgi:antiviral helicase SKI2
VSKHFRRNTAAILLKPAPLQTLESGRFENVKVYFILALVDHETKDGEHGNFIET